MMYPKDWGSQFVKLVATGKELAVPACGYYTATIVKVEGRSRVAVTSSSLAQKGKRDMIS